MSGRVCRKCGTGLGVDDELCPACGTRNPVIYPWYIYPLGFLIVAALFALLVDWGALLRYLAPLFSDS